ncbi:phage antirepressor N-terminal domain-containing protein [Ahrensia sp. R2A130]|uniref:phage antirepressor N-terminal domain-containing protein n=1 Tax=Ahrensia sp. R2A130 TaxID=744979 RepID=UPI0001E0B509|nr:phage antirepressor N-terminal domain-containing protein [Ahrensia sp. R2A130]EFL88279.1 antirepressor protein ant [Ahrensia sp. R2A130]
MTDGNLTTTTSEIKSDLKTFHFHGDEISTAMINGVPHVAMKPIVENLGMAWQAQHRKLLESGPKFSCNHMVTTGTDGKSYNMLAMPVTKLNLWLNTINPNKVKADIRAKLEIYQEQSAIALHDYWTTGVAVRPDAPQSAVDFSDPSLVVGLLRHLDNQVKEQQAEIINLTPKAEAFDDFLNAEGKTLPSAAMIEIGAKCNLAMRFMRQEKHFYARQGNNNTPSVYLREMGYAFVEPSYSKRDGKLYEQTYFTPRGIAWLNKIIPAELRNSPSHGTRRVSASKQLEVVA